MATYNIDNGRVENSIAVGSHPEGLALTSNQDFLLVLDTGSADVAIIRVKKLPATSKISAERALYNMVPVGTRPNDIVIKAFFKQSPKAN